MQKLIFVFLLSVHFLSAQKTRMPDQQLVAMLDSMNHAYQSYRQQETKAGNTYGWQSDERKTIQQAIHVTDSINQIRIARVLNTQGWPAEARVGETGSQALFIVVQQAPLAYQQKYLPLLREAVQKKQANGYYLALLEDRVLVKQGKKQLYGTQTETDMETGKERMRPVEDPAHLEQRRAALGLKPLNAPVKKKVMTDTLRIVVLSPHKITVAPDYQAEFERLNKELITKRESYKTQKLEQRSGQGYSAWPAHERRMSDNELNFYDSLSMDNFVSMIAREYIAYRLADPFEIDARLVFVVAAHTASDVKSYARMAGKKANSFVISFPEMQLEKKEGRLQVRTKAELYDATQHKIVVSTENTGTDERGKTDYPMCSGNGWDCAMVNSIYPALIPFLEAITGKEIR